MTGQALSGGLTRQGHHDRPGQKGDGTAAARAGAADRHAGTRRRGRPRRAARAGKRNLAQPLDVAVLVFDAAGLTADDDARCWRNPAQAAASGVIATSPICCEAARSGERSIASAKTGEGVHALKEASPPSPHGQAAEEHSGDFLQPGDTVVLVTPIDSSAPKGRMILPQQQILRELLDSAQRAADAGKDARRLALLKTPRRIVTDSQAFGGGRRSCRRSRAHLVFHLFARYTRAIWTADCGGAAALAAARRRHGADLRGLHPPPPVRRHRHREKLPGWLRLTAAGRSAFRLHLRRGVPPGSLRRTRS